MNPTGGRTPRPILFRAIIVLSILGSTVALVVAFGPSVLDRLGYERYYARTAPDGRTFRLERKVITWMPGPTVRCVVVESDGRQWIHALAEGEPSDEPEQRIRSALRESIPPPGSPPNRP